MLLLLLLSSRAFQVLPQQVGAQALLRLVVRRRITRLLQEPALCHGRNRVAPPMAPLQVRIQMPALIGRPTAAALVGAVRRHLGLATLAFSTTTTAARKMIMMMMMASLMAFVNQRTFVRTVDTFTLPLRIIAYHDGQAKLAHSNGLVVAQAKNADHVVAALMIKQSATSATMVATIKHGKDRSAGRAFGRGRIRLPRWPSREH